MSWYLLLFLVAVAAAEVTRIRPICAPPLCPEREGCRLRFLPDRICPICECPNRVCEPVKCESGCMTEMDPYGCPSCFCPECAPPFCPERKGCFLKNVAGMMCPQCVCPTLDDENDRSASAQNQCVEGQCGPDCQQQISPNGCPVCLCFLPCPSLKCPPGCEIETTMKGHCLGCDCSSTFEGCTPPQCDPGCEIVQPPNGCSYCFCRSECEPLQCPLQCVVKHLPGETCASCDCGETEDDCRPLKCHPECSAVTPSNGCPYCQCRRQWCQPQQCQEESQIKISNGELCPKCQYGQETE